MITLNFKLTKEDYFNFYHHTIWLAPGKKTEALKTRGKNFLLFIVMLFVVKFSAPGKTFDSYFFFSIFILACIFLFPLLSIKTESRKQTFAFLNNPLNVNILTQTETIISGSGIFAKNIFAEAKYEWKCIMKKEETKEYYFLYINSHQAIIIPKRVLVSEIEKENLSKLLSQNISFDAEVGHLVKD